VNASVSNDMFLIKMKRFITIHVIKIWGKISMKKIFIVMVVLMFVCSALPTLLGQGEDTTVLEERKPYIENRAIVPIYTGHGLEKVPPASKAKPPTTTVTITYPSDGATVSGTITITIESNVVPTITIDGATVGTGLSYVWDTTTYADGTHTIKAIAGKKSDTATVTVSNGGGGGGGDGVVRKWAFVIGISDYEGTANDLTYCDDDAMDWKNFLQGEGYTVTILTDTQATADNIEAKIIDLLANEDADDYVVFCYSGHGYNYPGYGSCMISTDLYYITHGWVESYFDTAESQHIYFAFDACEIGGMQGLIQTGRVGAFASNAKLSYDGDSSMKNGVFTYYQMVGWGSYDNFEEDAAYAVQYMKTWASQYHVRVDPFYKDSFTGPMIP
jgi:hypothetical protein